MACDEFMPRDENILSTEFFNSGAILALTVSVLVPNMGFSPKNFYAHIVAHSGYICQCGEIAGTDYKCLGRPGQFVERWARLKRTKFCTKLIRLL